MKLSVVACCRSCDRDVVVEGRALVVLPPERRRWRKRRRLLASRGGGNVNNVADWTPSLTSISEDDHFPEKDQRKQQQQQKESQMIKTKTESSSKYRTNQPNHYYHEDVRRTPSFSAMFPAFSPTPLFF